MPSGWNPVGNWITCGKGLPSLPGDAGKPPAKTATSAASAVQITAMRCIKYPSGRSAAVRRIYAHGVQPVRGPYELFTRRRAGLCKEEQYDLRERRDPVGT